MKAVFKKTDGDFLEAAIEVDGMEVLVMDDFGGSEYEAGDEINLHLSVGLYFDEEDWDSMFSGNPEAKKELEHQSGWRYRAYGVIVSVDPEVIVDVGITQLAAPINSSDPRMVGESIAFTIERLDAQP